MKHLDLSADELVSALLQLSFSETVCLLDSCGVKHLGSHLLIAGIDPVSIKEISAKDPEQVLKILDEAVGAKDLASIFTISYDFGKELLNISLEKTSELEPAAFLAQFDCLVVHDYTTGATNIHGNSARMDSIASKLASHVRQLNPTDLNRPAATQSNFTRTEYLAAIETIKDLIREGNTYQTNLTQQLSVNLSEGITPQLIFQRLRHEHPAPFAAFITRKDSTIVSASPERFFRIEGQTGRISTSPIKGTRARGKTPTEDEALRHDLLNSEKDRAENTMIVDLLRNDLGRVCEFGSIVVERLCCLEEHPTLFHLVSTISGTLKKEVAFSDVIKAVFPCGSITGAPKISTMRVIDQIENTPRGLSMGAIGYYVPKDTFEMAEALDVNVAIRTMVIRDNAAVFNVGGGIVIDSDPVAEYDESVIKAKALLAAIGAGFEFQM